MVPSSLPAIDSVYSMYSNLLSDQSTDNFTLGEASSEAAHEGDFCPLCSEQRHDSGRLCDGRPTFKAIMGVTFSLESSANLTPAVRNFISSHVTLINPVSRPPDFQVWLLVMPLIALRKLRQQAHLHLLLVVQIRESGTSYVGWGFRTVQGMVNAVDSGRLGGVLSETERNSVVQILATLPTSDYPLETGS
jgi:hypothetical protein